jgi:hypothetical protein
MAKFGAMILMDNGNPFVTPQSTPFCLYGKYTFNSSANGSSQQVAQNIALNAVLDNSCRLTVNRDL